MGNCVDSQPRFFVQPIIALARCAPRLLCCGCCPVRCRSLLDPRSRNAKPHVTPQDPRELQYVDKGLQQSQNKQQLQQRSSASARAWADTGGGGGGAGNGKAAALDP